MTAMRNGLPSHLNLEMVAVELGLNVYSVETQLKLIIQRQRNNGLKLQTNSLIDCKAQKVADGLEEDRDASGNLIFLSCGPEAHIDTSGSSHLLGKAIASDNTFVASTFIFQDTEYYPLDQAGMHPVFLRYDWNDIYVDRIDLEKLLSDGIEDIPPYADPTSEHFAPELVLAMELHQALRIEKDGNIDRSMVDRVSSWLSRNRPDLKASDAIERRLATIIGKANH